MMKWSAIIQLESKSDGTIPEGTADFKFQTIWNNISNEHEDYLRVDFTVTEDDSITVGMMKFYWMARARVYLRGEGVPAVKIKKSPRIGGR